MRSCQAPVLGAVLSCSARADPTSWRTHLQQITASADSSRDLSATSLALARPSISAIMRFATRTKRRRLRGSRLTSHYTLELSHAISSGTRWLRSNRTPDGLYPTCDLVSHYKSPLLLAEAGFAADGQTVLGWLVENYMTKSGHFHDPADAAAKSRFCDLYEDLWIAWGAARLHDEETARVTFDFCVSFLSDRHGGVSSNVSMAAGRCAQLYDLRSTALTGITALAQHRTDVAKACALFVTQLIQAQAAESSQFFIVRNEKGNLITEYPEELARIFVISADSRTPGGVPLYYALALAVIFLFQLYCATMSPEYLDTAKQYAIVCSRHADFIFRNHYSGKVAWAFSDASQAYHRIQYTSTKP